MAMSAVPEVFLTIPEKILSKQNLKNLFYYHVIFLGLEI